MANLTFEGVGITGISACVPKTKDNNSKYKYLFGYEDFEKSIEAIGIVEKRVADVNTCASDLCFVAAEKLFEDLKIDRDSIDVLIFMTQTPDYQIPATSPSLQHRLKLPKSTACFDINLACSGYIYSLCTAFAYASQPGIRKVLLLAGETLSKFTSQNDKSTVLLFGDAGSATLVEKNNEFKKTFFSLNSDGSGTSVLKIPNSGYREAATVKSFDQVKDKDGNSRNGFQLYMDGMEVFNFTMREVPKDIKKLLEFSNKTIDGIDFIVFHQANKFMTDFFAKKMKYPLNRVPYSLDRFGNTSTVSIPLNIVSEMQHSFEIPKQILMAGFGAGLSWGSALIENFHCHLTELIEI
jgi:3-oxoacyl-[acyl-carrier-protein] synthase III